MLWPGMKKLGRELYLKRTNSEIVGMMKICFVNIHHDEGIGVLEIHSPKIDYVDRENIASVCL
jgi:hypothetical protein